MSFAWTTLSLIVLRLLFTSSNSNVLWTEIGFSCVIQDYVDLYPHVRLVLVLSSKTASEWTTELLSLLLNEFLIIFVKEICRLNQNWTYWTLNIEYWTLRRRFCKINFGDWRLKYWRVESSNHLQDGFNLWHPREAPVSNTRRILLIPVYHLQVQPPEKAKNP